MSIHEHTPDHLWHVATFWANNINRRHDPEAAANDGTPCACCGVKMHTGLDHFAYSGKWVDHVGYPTIHVCSECVARYAEYVEFCGEVCADCGNAIVDGEECENDHGDHICADCFAENYVECADCCAIVREDEARENADGDPICEECSDNYYTCEDCDCIVHSDDVNSVHDRIVCNTCLENDYSRCEDCEEYVANDNAIDLANGGAVCSDCYCNNYNRCETCGEVFHCDDGQYVDDEDNEGWFCASCYSERANRTIHDYSYKPEWEYQSSAADTSSHWDRFYLGVELEVENKACRADNEGVASNVIGTVPAICKHDGSIHNGFEVVFHPQTYNYATTEGKPAISEMLDDLRRHGFAGHNYGGMHVHITRAAFTRLHLYKFHRLFRQCANLFTFISQRKADKLSRWASFEYMGDLPGGNIDRYAALNYTRHTVEVRIFNSTIRPDRFFKNLEAVKAALDFSKQYGIRDMEPSDFVRFIMDNRAQYKNLASFLVERTTDTLTAAHVDEKAIRQVQKSLSRRSA